MGKTLYEMAKDNHDGYFDLAIGAAENASRAGNSKVTQEELIRIVWHILDRLKSKGWIDENKTKVG